MALHSVTLRKRMPYYVRTTKPKEDGDGHLPLLYRVIVLYRCIGGLDSVSGRLTRWPYNNRQCFFFFYTTACRRHREPKSDYYDYYYYYHYYSCYDTQ